MYTLPINLYYIITYFNIFYIEVAKTACGMAIILYTATREIRVNMFLLAFLDTKILSNVLSI